ncbi:MAG: AraC family transcriptional regulator [Bryobacteraceae bacterium]|nr:AraC family transcriptional regulator [Bryobacteraceae bacterium]
MSTQPQPDLLSEVLGSVKLDTAFYFNAEFSAPWTVHTPHSCRIAPYLAPNAEHLIIFHMLVAGRMYARLESGERLMLEPGDIVTFPHGDAHVLGNGPETLRIEASETLSHVLNRGLEMARFGSGGEATRVVCGFMALDPRLCGTILGGLPPMLKVSLRQDPSGHWLENSILFSVTQAGAADAGSRAVLARLSETLFIETIRRYIQQLPDGETGWLAGTRDPVVGQALAVLHRNPGNAWTIASLAQEVGISRSVLADRFKNLLGEAPMAYLTRLRLQLGAKMLTTTRRSVAEIASDAGYESEASFNRAFKREFGLPPARFRNEALLSRGRATGTVQSAGAGG